MGDEAQPTVTGDATAIADPSAADVPEIAADFDQADALKFLSELPEGEQPAAPATGDAPAPAGDAPKPAEPAPAETPSEKRARQMLADVARRERRILERKQAAGDVETRARNFDAIRDGLRTKPLATLRELGMSLDEFLAAGQAESRDPDAPAAAPPPATDPRLDEFLAHQAEREVVAAKEAVHAAVKASDKYPRINRSDSQSLVSDLMIEYHAKHGAPLDRDIAAAQVEKYLAQIAGEPISKPAPKPAASTEATPTSQRPGSPTLSNRDNSQLAPGDGDLPLDPDERYAAVMRRLELVA